MASRHVDVTDHYRDALRWIRLFNRLDGAISHHQRAKGAFHDDVDAALYEARRRVLSDAHKGRG